MAGRVALTPRLRQARIAELVRKHGQVTVEDLADRFGASLETIRRDLGALAETGAVQKVHGGAKLPPRRDEGPFRDRMTREEPAKRMIAALAARALSPGETLFVPGAAGNTGVAAIQVGKAMGARVLAAASLIVAGALLLGWRGPERLAQRALPWWQRQVASRLGRLAPSGLGASVLLGSAWALLPCGLLYAALFLTASQAGPAQGALAMLAFGIGTVPATLASALGLLHLRRQRQGSRWTRPAGALLASLGLLALLAPWLTGHDWLGPAAQFLLECTTPGA